MTYDQSLEKRNRFSRRSAVLLFVVALVALLFITGELRVLPYLFTYIICASFVALPPEMATTLGAYVTHMNLTDVGRSVSMGGALIRGAFVTVFVALVCASSGWLYNRLDQR